MFLLCFASRMAVDSGHRDSGCDWEGRWNHVKKFLERPGPFTHPDFEPSTEVIIVKMCGCHKCSDIPSFIYNFVSNQSLQFLLETCKILVIGAGGLGCELLKNLVSK